MVVTAAVSDIVSLHSAALLEDHLRTEIVHRLGPLSLADLLMVILLLLLLVLLPVDRILSRSRQSAIPTGRRVLVNSMDSLRRLKC